MDLFNLFSLNSNPLSFEGEHKVFCQFDFKSESLTKSCGRLGPASAGSIVASQIALGHNFEKIIDKNKKVNSLKMFKEYGLPYISLIKSNKIEQAAKISAENRDIEDLWIPFFAPATDLTNSKLINFVKGPLWEAIRSSGALPGIVLPHFMNENIIVDGGLMNNLPVDIMRDNYGGKIIVWV